MIFQYSVLKFVPNPVRGEFINIGIIVGSDENSEWRLKIVDNYSRARKIDEIEILPRVLHYLTKLSSQIDDYCDPIDSLFEPEQEINSDWLRHLYISSQNVLQLSPPAPVISDSIEHAIELIYDEFVVDPEARRFDFKKKNEVTSSLRKIYSSNGLKKGKDFFEKISIHGPHHRENYDFAVANGKILQLSQTYSFQLPDKHSLAEDIKALAWSVQEIRSKGGTAKLKTTDLTVPSNVEISVVYIPPKPDQSNSVLDEALSAFREVSVDTIEYSQAGQIGDRAKALLRI